MSSSPVLSLRLVAARANRTRLASSSALRRSWVVLSGALLNIDPLVYHRALILAVWALFFPQSAGQIRGADPRLIEVGRELVEYLLRISNEARRANLHGGSPGEHELHHVHPARDAAAAYDRHTDRPRDVVDGP